MFNLLKTAVLMAAITAPFMAVGGGLRGMFSTHPSTEERVTRLLAMVKR